MPDDRSEAPRTESCASDASAADDLLQGVALLARAMRKTIGSLDNRSLDGSVDSSVDSGDSSAQAPTAAGLSLSEFSEIARQGGSRILELIGEIACDLRDPERPSKGEAERSPKHSDGDG